MITSERHQKAFLGGTERFIGKEEPDLIPKTSLILVAYYVEDLIEKDVAQAWCSKASKKYVDLATSKKIRLATKQFVDYLENEDSSDEDEEDD